MQNPFIGFGKPVSGARLVGRSVELGQLLERINESSVSLSVIGQGRIGKTSLVHEAIAEAEKKKSPYLSIISIDLSVFPDSKTFFDCILEELRDDFIRIGRELPAGFVQLLSSKPDSSYEAYRRCKRGLQVLYGEGYLTKLIIDEFDSVRTFDDAERTIWRLRDLIDSGHKTGFSCVFVSRRSLYAIEKQLHDISTLDGVCEKMYVRPIDKQGIDQMLERCKYCWAVSGEDYDTFIQHTGGHPYLAEMILCRGFETKSVHNGITCSVGDIYDFYNHLRDLLKQDDLFDQLIQITIGPCWSLRVDSIQKLARYGIIHTSSDANHAEYASWSEHFQNYLEKCDRETPTWALIGELERSLRDFIEKQCLNVIGKDWVSQLGNRNKTIQTIICDCEDRREKDRISFGLDNSRLFLDYTYPQQLCAIMTSEWNIFGPLLKKNKHYWQERFDLLSKVRTPYAHNRDNVVSKSELALAQAYCKELLSVIS